MVDENIPQKSEKVVISISVDKENLRRLKEHLVVEHSSVNISHSFDFWLRKFVGWLDRKDEENSINKKEIEDDAQK